MASASTNPIYPSVVRAPRVSIATANTARDGTGTLGTLYTCPGTAATPPTTPGAIVQSITIQATGTTTAGMVRIFHHDGTNFSIIREIAVSALTPSATVKAFGIPTSEGADVNGRLILNKLLEPGHGIRVSTHNAETFIVTADIGEY